MNDKIPAIRIKPYHKEWKKSKLKEVANVYDGVHKTPKYLDEGIMFLSVEDIDTLQSNKFIAREDFKKDFKVYPQKGDVLMTRIGDVGTPNVVSTNELVAYYVSLALIKPFNMDPCFLSNCICSNSFKKGLKERTLTTAVPQKINKNQIGEIEIIYTEDIEEQKSIGESFSSLDYLITLHQRKYDKFVATKKALIEKIFPKKASNVPQLRFKGYESPWQKKTLGKIGTTYTGLSGKTKDDFGHGEARFVTYVNVFKNPIADIKGVDFVEIDDSQNIVKNGDVLFTTSSETPEEVGMSSVWLGDTENTYLNSFCFGYRLFSSEKIDPLYLAYLLRSPEVRKEFQFLAQGISRYNISKTKVMDIVLSVPEDYEEQVKIGKLFFNLDKLIELTQKKYEKLESLKKAMLNKMFV